MMPDDSRKVEVNGDQPAPLFGGASKAPRRGDKHATYAPVEAIDVGDFRAVGVGLAFLYARIILAVLGGLCFLIVYLGRDPIHGFPPIVLVGLLLAGLVLTGLSVLAGLSGMGCCMTTPRNTGLRQYVAWSILLNLLGVVAFAASCVNLAWSPTLDALYYFAIACGVCCIGELAFVSYLAQLSIIADDREMFKVAGSVWAAILIFGAWQLISVFAYDEKAAAVPKGILPQGDWFTPMQYAIPIIAAFVGVIGYLHLLGRLRIALREMP